MKNISVDIRLKSKIELFIHQEGTENECYSIKLKDIDETFWFEDMYSIQEFVNVQARERFYDKTLREGYFEYVNEHDEKIIYNILSVKYGNITV